MKKLFIYTLFLTFWGCSSVFYFPTSYFYADPKKHDINYKDIDFISTDGTKLHGWLLSSDKTKKKKGLILHFHGNAHNLTCHWMNLGWLTKSGYDIFIFDYRGYGLSKGQANQQGLNKDSIAALNWAYEKQKSYPKFIVYGQSLGGAVSMRALKDFEHRDEIDLFVLDSTFISYQSIAFDKVKNAGSVFVGDYTPESAGDYASGTNHVLPTYGYSATYSSLNLLDFFRTYTVQTISKSGLTQLSKAILPLADAEGLDAHANAVSIRLEAIKNEQ